MLLKHGADVNISGSVGDRPLHLAAGKGYVRVTQYLVEGTGKSKANGEFIFSFCKIFTVTNCYFISFNIIRIFHQ